MSITNFGFPCPCLTPLVAWYPYPTAVICSQKTVFDDSKYRAKQNILVLVL